MIKKWGNFFDHCENRKTTKLLFLFPRSSGTIIGTIFVKIFY